MIPHAVHGFEGSGLPENLPYFLTLSGYMLIFFVEKIAFDAHHIMHEGEAGHDHNHDDGPSKSITDGKPAAAGPPSGRSATILLLALGVHALMETMALGLSSNKLNAGLLAMSIGLHQVRSRENIHLVYRVYLLFIYLSMKRVVVIHPIQKKLPSTLDFFNFFFIS